MDNIGQEYSDWRKFIFEKQTKYFSFDSKKNQLDIPIQLFENMAWKYIVELKGAKERKICMKNNP